MVEPTYGRFSPNEVRKRVLDGDWVSASPQRAVLSANPAPSATKTTYPGYVVMTFTSTGTLEVSGQFGGPADVLLVGGGAPGGSGGGSGGTGGTGAAVKTQPLTIQASTPVPVVIGGASGASTVGPLTSAGGTAAGTGGSGATNQVGATAGSQGTTNTYRTGSNQLYGGGGGGGGFGNYLAGPAQFYGTPGAGGGQAGGGSGGNAGAQTANNGGPGQANTGGAGGGGGGEVTQSGLGQQIHSGSGGTGGSGIVVLRFPNLDFE